jgi:hypothetical protein
MAPSFSTLAGGLAFFGSASLALALPTVATSSLYAADPNAAGTFLWLSNVSPTIFGQDATRFDYYLYSPSASAADAVDQYAKTMAVGTEDDIVTAFLNATMAGTLSNEQAADAAWKCLELGELMASKVASCQAHGHHTVERRADVAEPDLSKRSRFNWEQSSSHVPSNNAVQALHTTLGINPSYQFPSSPRSFCNTFNDGTNACLSWSSVQTFDHDDGQYYIEDAASVVNFDRTSAEARGILNGADVCISNRANGCT